MRLLILVTALMFVALSSSETVLYPRGCIYVLGKCVEECPVGTHGYGVGCGYKTPEPTCKEPSPVPETGKLCDYSACYCDPPTIRDEKTDKCVLPKDCQPEDKSNVLIDPPGDTLLPPVEEVKSKPPKSEEPKTKESSEESIKEA